MESTRRSTWAKAIPASPEADTSRVSAIVSVAFSCLNLRERARILRRLLASVGPLALTVVAGGAFARYVAHARLPEVPISLDDVARVSGEQVHEIVRYVEQSNPQLLSQLVDLFPSDPMIIRALGASVAAFAFDNVAKRTV